MLISAWYVHGIKQDASKMTRASRLIHFEYLVIKKSEGVLPSPGGPERIRTAVEAFAELCLATRPQDQCTSMLPEQVQN